MKTKCFRFTLTNKKSSRPGAANRQWNGAAGLMVALIGLLAHTAGIGTGLAATITVPNNSFGSPKTTYADPRIDAWQKAPKPGWYDESGGFYWDQLAGVFLNSPPADASFIDNCDGVQALFLFAVPQMSLFQDYDSTDWSNSVPSHAFNAKYEAGKAYRLTIGVIGGGGNMASGVTMELRLYYRDSASNLVTVAATTITNYPTIFTKTTHLIDFLVDVPVVKASDDWAGKHIGIQLRSTVGFDLMGGYWDLDNVRLVEIRVTTLLEPVWTGGHFQFTVQSEPGRKLEILSSTNLTLALSEWTSLGVLTNDAGSVSFTNTAKNERCFYQARKLP